MNPVVKAEVINAVLEPVYKVLQQCAGIAGGEGKMALSTKLNYTPCMTVTIELRGKVMGPVVCDLDSDLASRVAGRMCFSDGPVPLDSAECQDAIAELANILIGNATDALANAGYDVEVSLPAACVRRETKELAGCHVDYTIQTEFGRMSILIGLQEVQS